MAGPSYTLAKLAEHTGTRCVGDRATNIVGLGSLAHAQPGQITHLSNSRFRDQLATTHASAVILAEAELAHWAGNALVTPNPYLAFARVSQLFAPQHGVVAGTHPQANVDPSASVAASASLGPGEVVGANANIGANVQLRANVVVGDGCKVAADCVLMPNVVLYADVQLGPRCVIHSGAVLGADGFGFAPDDAGHLHPIAQLGGVRLGADVLVGAASTIDRGAIDDTVVEDGVKIDNQVQVGHNCRIGAHTVICGCVGIAGSVTIGKHCIIAGACGIGGAGPIEIVDRVVLTAATNVLSSIREPGTYSSGTLHSPTSQWKRNALRFSGLDKLSRRLARLESAQPNHTGKGGTDEPAAGNVIDNK